MNTAELKKLAEAATPGPWRCAGFRVTAKELGYARVADTEYDNESMAENAAYIAAANPAAILELLSELQRLSAELEALKKAISEAQPVAHIRKNGFRFLGEIEPQDDSETPLYTLKGIK